MSRSAPPPATDPYAGPPARRSSTAPVAAMVCAIAIVVGVVNAIFGAVLLSGRS